MSKRNRNRNRKAESSAETAAPEAQPLQLLFLDEHLTASRSSTRAEVVLREAVENEFRKVHAMLREFVQAELDKGYSVEEVLSMYRLMTCLVPTYSIKDGKPKVRMTAEIVAHDDEDEGDA